MHKDIDGNEIEVGKVYIWNKSTIRITEPTNIRLMGEWFINNQEYDKGSNFSGRILKLADNQEHWNKCFDNKEYQPVPSKTADNIQVGGIYQSHHSYILVEKTDCLGVFGDRITISSGKYSRCGNKNRDIDYAVIKSEITGLDEQWLRHCFEQGEYVRKKDWLLSQKVMIDFRESDDRPKQHKLIQEFLFTKGFGRWSGQKQVSYGDSDGLGINWVNFQNFWSDIPLSFGYCANNIEITPDEFIKLFGLGEICDNSVDIEPTLAESGPSPTDDKCFDKIEIDKLRKENATLKQQRDDFFEQIQSIQKEYDKLVDINSELLMKSEQLDSKNMDLNRKNRELDEQIIELCANNLELQYGVGGSDKTVGVLNSEIERLLEINAHVPSPVASTKLTFMELIFGRKS